jgi:hypothetical protein
VTLCIQAYWLLCGRAREERLQHLQFACGRELWTTEWLFCCGISSNVKCSLSWAAVFVAHT